MFKRLFGLDEAPEITMMADTILGRREEPAKLASAVGIVWTPALQKQWESRYTRCSGCRVWIKGKRSLWCEMCKNKGF